VGSQMEFSICCRVRRCVEIEYHRHLGPAIRTIFPHPAPRQ